MIISYDKTKTEITKEDLAISKRIDRAKQKKSLSSEQEEIERRLKYRKNVFGLKAPSDRIIISIDSEYKNWVSIGNLALKLERNMENMNRRYTAPTNAFVIDAEDLPSGAEVIVDHNSDHDTNRIFGVDEDIDVKGVHYYSIPQNEAYIWRENDGEWQPCKDYILGKRVYKKYQGVLQGIEDEELIDYLYVTSDCELKGKVVKTMRHSLYEMIFNDQNQKEQRIIRVRHNDKRDEIMYVDEMLTNQIQTGEIVIK